MGNVENIMKVHMQNRVLYIQSIRTQRYTLESDSNCGDYSVAQ